MKYVHKTFKTCYFRNKMAEKGTCGNELSFTDRFCFKCGSKVESKLSVCNQAKTLDHYMSIKGECRVGFNTKISSSSSKRKSTRQCPPSKKPVDNRVVIQVDIITENDGILTAKRGSKLPVKVCKDFDSEKVLAAAIKKHSDHDQFFVLMANST